MPTSAVAPTLPARRRSAHRPRRSGRDRLATLAAGLVTAAVFGPYTVLPGVRFEQLAVYGTVCVAAPVLLLRLRPGPHWKLVVSAMALTLVFATVGGLLLETEQSRFTPNSPWAGLDNLLLPIAVLLLGQFLLVEGERDRLLRVVLRTVVVAMGVNTVLALASIRFDLTGQLSAFWTDEGAASVATKAAEMGRLTGIFNQPAEAGVLYGLAALAAVRLWPDRRLRLALSLVVLTIGGLLTVSKIFLIVAVPLVVVQLLAQRAHRLARLAVVGLATVGVMAALNSPYMSYWLGERFLLRLFDPSDDLVDFYTAGRIGPGSGFGDVIDVTSQTSGLFGVGIRGMTLAYDNAWVEAYVMAGVVGVLGYTAVLLGLAHAVVTGWRRWAPEEAHFAAAVVVLTVVSSIGVPVLSANRAGSAVCLVLALTVLAGTARRSGTPPGVTGTPAVIPPRSAPLNG